MTIQCSSRRSRGLFAASLAATAAASSANAGLVAVSGQSVWNYYLATAGLAVETETFNGIANGLYTSPFAGSTASIAWTASADGGISVQDGVFSTSAPATLLFTFSPGVRAVAGNFFGTDGNSTPVSVLYTAKLTDGSGYSGIAEGASSFTGFFAQSASATIAALTLTVTNISGPVAVFPSVDNLYFGVPAPGAVSLLGVAGMIAARRRR